MALHLHIGSQITSLEPYRSALRRRSTWWTRRKAAAGVPLQFLDAGGGFAVPYREPAREVDADARDARRDYFSSRLSSDDYAAASAPSFGRGGPAWRWRSSRAAPMVAAAAVLLARVESEKTKGAATPRAAAGATSGG